ncbi:MAG: phytanoyl-CoA dioxygenase family protein [Sphingomonadales bacterium]|nr:phytanoyl-CoA dioxygenase family protein [Sphingomonadales bacterium]
MRARARTRWSGFMPVLDPNAANVRVFYLLEMDALFRELIRHPAALALVRSLLGPDAMVSNFTANIARPGSRSMALHSDQSLVVPEPWVQSWAINIIWCLTDVTFENAGTLHIPGSQHWQARAEANPPEEAEGHRPMFASAYAAALTISSPAAASSRSEMAFNRVSLVIFSPVRSVT